MEQFKSCGLAVPAGIGTPEQALSEYEFRLLRDHIHEYCGIFFDDGKLTSLASKLSFRMRLLDIRSYGEYYAHLKYTPRYKEEMEDLIPHLTNNETYFFREMNQLGFFVGELAGRIKAEKAARGDRRLRILSCGCSSGEEAFTLAILLEEAGHYLRDWEVEITGIDIDRKVLERAAAGSYNSYSLRATDRSMIDRYFDKDGERYVLKPRIRERVAFRRGNLLEPASLSGLKGVDAIFCRNVFIYFSDDAIRRIAENFHGALSDDGYLMLGHSESLTRVTDIFYPRRFPGVIVYAKKES
ncbi:MAG: protein-glutamate O-methyltransferase CheR [Nitrospirae bacterium]|nr:protein-glutamate O-methyltransferase CheR [Nitrospirota bacterium]MBI5696571.1 protein-glutamate O-methyltransferase CheR [Nitrospirota bacterium]